MRSVKKRRCFLFILAVVAVFFGGAVGALGGGEKEATKREGKAKEEKMLIVGYMRAPDTLDIHKSTWIDDTTSIVFAPLLNIASTDGSLILGLASSYEISENSKAITLHLREGIKDAKGNPITTRDIEFAYDRYKDPETKSPSVSLYLDDLKEIKVADDSTFQLIFDKPYGPLLTFLTMQSTGPFSKEYFEEIGEVAFGQRPVGPGIYYVEKWVRGSHIDYVKNPYYKREYNQDPGIKNEGPPYIDKVRFRIIQEPFTLVSELTAGNVHVLHNTPPEHYQELKDNPKVSMTSYLEYVLHYIGFNCKKAPFDDIRLRQAIAMAVEREPIVEYGAEGLAVPIHGPLVPTMGGYSEEMEKYAKGRYPYDPEKAKQLLADAGWKDTDKDGMVDKDGKPFEAELWISNAYPEGRKVATIVQDQLSKIGLKIEIRLVEESTFTELVSKGNHQMYIFRYGLMDAQILYYMFRSQYGVKRMFYYTTELDAALDDMGSILDPKQRQKAIERAEKLLIEGSPMVPLHARKVFVSYRNDKVEGIKVNPYTQAIVFDDARMK